jgi:hypothetical protein
LILSGSGRGCGCTATGASLGATQVQLLRHPSLFKPVKVIKLLMLKAFVLFEPAQGIPHSVKAGYKFDARDRAATHSGRAMRASTMSALRHAESECDVLWSTLINAAEQQSCIEICGCGIHDIKQRSNYTMIGAARLPTASREFGNMQSRFGRSSSRRWCSYYLVILREGGGSTSLHSSD